MVNCRRNSPGIIVDEVQISDLENASYLPSGRCIKGMLAGNDNWRSPEAHLKDELNKPTDMFSFGIVVSAFILIDARSLKPSLVHICYTRKRYIWR